MIPTPVTFAFQRITSTFAPPTLFQPAPGGHRIVDGQSGTQRNWLAQRIQAHITLADPVTWISPALMCLSGSIASRRFSFSNPLHRTLATVGMLMTGPLCTGFSQSINDYFDRELDAINDPTRPIPAGEITLEEARLNWIALGLATFSTSMVFRNSWVTLLVAGGLFLSVIYSIPQIKLKKHFWLGAPAVGFGYVSLSWCAGHMIFNRLTWPSFIAAMLNGGIATGLIMLNDIKSIEGDRQHGLKSLTVMLGPRQTLLVAHGIIALCEVMFMAFARTLGHTWISRFVVLSLLVPIPSTIRLYQHPTHENFKWYIISSNGFLVTIQILSALVVGGYFDKSRHNQPPL